MALRKKAGFIFKFIIGPALLLLGLVAVRIYTYGNNVVDVNGDAAIVLGAAVWGDEVSPVFRERINHAIDLYRSGKVRKIIFTGGQGNRDELTEAAEARQFAIKNGIPEKDILIEERSHTTYENVVNAKRVADANGLKRVLIVSDPMHMRRAVASQHPDCYSFGTADRWPATICQRSPRLAKTSINLISRFSPPF